MAKRISIRKKEDTCKTLSKSQMAGLAVLIIRPRPLVHRTGYDGPGKKKTAATGGRNAFLTGRFLPIAADYLVEDETGGHAST